MVAPADAPLTLRLLGPLEVRQPRHPQPIVLRRLSPAVLAYLAAAGRPVARQALSDLFCQSAADPAGALRSILSRLRQRLGPGVLQSGGAQVSLNGAVWADCREFARGLEHNPAALPLETLAAVVDLYRGDFLADFSQTVSAEFELWLLAERARYQRLLLAGLELLVTRLAEAGQLAQAVARGRQWVQAAPLSEAAHAHLMWVYARDGQRGAALAQFDQCAQYLQRELAVAPTPELQALRDAIAAGRLGPPPWQAAAPGAGEGGGRLGRAASPPSDLVGREAELALLRQAWLEAAPNRPAVVLLEAEAGMGKTRLVQAFAQLAPGAAFLAGACYESARALAYSPWLDVLEARLAALDDAALTSLSELSAGYLGRLVPTLARRLRLGLPPTPPTSGGELARLFAALREFLLELPGSPGLILFIDNLQWADEASLQVFHFLARPAPPGPQPRARLLLVGALRTDEAESAPALQALKADLALPAQRHLRLAPLTPPAVTELSRRLWPSLPEGYRPHVCDLLVRATGGNPLFVTEILRELAHTAEVPAALPVPPTVHDLIRRRLLLMPEASRQVVEALAILDMPATLAQVEATSGRSEDETVAGLDLALRRGLLQPGAAAAPLTYDFSHDLVREVVAGQLSLVRRQRLHRRAALHLERTGAPAATLAYHWHMAGDAAQEAHYAALAGEQAAATYANQEAVRYLERALTLAAEPETRLRLMSRLGDTWMLTGAWDQAEHLFQQALALAELHGDRQRQAQFQSALGKLMSRRGRLPQALHWLEQARHTWQAAGDLAGLASAVGTLGIVYWQMDDYDRALDCYQQALDINTQLNNKAGIAIWLGNIGSVYLLREDYDAALKYHEESLRLRQELGMERDAAIETGNIGNIYAERRVFHKALGYHLEALRLRRGLGDKPGVVTVLGLMGMDYFGLGAHPAALACLRAALHGSLELGNWEGTALQLGRLGEVLAATGDTAAAMACLDRSIQLFQQLGTPHYLSEQLAAKAHALAAAGDLALAHDFNTQAAQTAAGVNPQVAFNARLLDARLSVALGTATAAQAAEALAAWLPEHTRPHETAALRYTLWQLAPQAPASRAHAEAAAAEYAALYAQTAYPEYGRRHAELTGAPTPPAASAVPPVPDTGSPPPPELDALLALVDEQMARHPL